MQRSIKFTVLGGGSWATAIVKMLTENQKVVGWYMRSEEAVNYIKSEKHNPNYLSSVEFKPEQLDLTSDINVAIESADILIFAIPSAFLESELKKITIPLKEKVIFSAIKGIVPETGLIVGQHFNKQFNIPMKT